MYIFRILTFLLLCSQFFFFSDHNFQDLYFQNAFTKISASEINNKETFENTDLFHSFEREKLTKHQHYQAFWIYIYVKIDFIIFGKKRDIFQEWEIFFFWDTHLQTYTKSTNYKSNHDKKNLIIYPNYIPWIWSASQFKMILDYFPLFLCWISVQSAR